MTPLSAAALTNARRFAAFLRMVSLLIEKVAGDGLEGGRGHPPPGSRSEIIFHAAFHK